MKTIAISTAEKSLDAPVEVRFGRARFFILVDPGTMEWEALENLPSLSANQMVGVRTAERLVRKNIQTIMTGKCGSKAFAELKLAGVQVILDTKGTVRQALDSLIRGEVSPATGPNAT
ncbi:MAG: dinitrogenase iron-molybdenum cofactor biosynthesis protein [Proteobacteria bacterium]|nr:dinitrogenase iron-molybdenum cofactor biosynthesis protein [Pseudomonadota bacterium]